MQKSKVTIEMKNTAVLCGKNAAQFVQKANEFESSIFLECGTCKTNAKSLLGVMSLGTFAGGSVILTAEGSDAEEAVAALQRMYY